MSQREHDKQTRAVAVKYWTTKIKSQKEKKKKKSWGGGGGCNKKTESAKKSLSYFHMEPSEAV